MKFICCFLALFASVVAQGQEGQVRLPGGPCMVESSDSWSDPEIWVWLHVCIGEIAVLSNYDGRNLDPHSQKGWDKDRILSQDFLESILLHEPWRSAVTRYGVRIRAAYFPKNLNLSNGIIPFPLWLENSRFTQGVNFADFLSESHMSFDGSHVEPVFDMPLSKVHSNLFLGSNSTFDEINMNGATIGGDVALNGATVSGRVNMRGATIAGNLIMNNKGEFASVLLDRVKIGGSLAFADSTVTGILSMESTEIGDDLFLRFGKFERPIDAVFLRIGGSLNLRGAQLAGLNLTGAHIESQLIIASEPGEGTTGPLIPTWQPQAELILRNTVVHALQDTADPDAWPLKLDLDGFQYNTLGGLGASTNYIKRGTDAYVSWLGRDQPYTPQPYYQLASVLRQMGHKEEAGDILYAGREGARAVSLTDGHYASWLGQTALKYTVGYGLGNRIFLCLLWVIGLVLLGAFMLQLFGQTIEPGHDGKSDMKLSYFYSLDMLMPIIQLRGRHYEVDLEKDGLRYYYYFHQIMGYVLATFLIAGVAGLTE